MRDIARLVVFALALATPLQSQVTRSRVAIGQVRRPAADGKPVPVAGQWVVLHRVGSDRAAPLDSAKSGPDGRFRIRYQPYGAPDALYFVSSRYHGIAYFSPPLRGDTVRGGDADIIVYETTTDTSKLRTQGRHFVVGAPRGKVRDIAEVFELENEGTATVVARDSVTPVWSTHVPSEAESLSVAPGDVGAGAVVFRDGRADVFAPFSPGVRQVAITYQLRTKAFPLSVSLERPVSVFELLMQENRGSAEGTRLLEVAPARIDGRSYRRFLAQDVPANGVIRVAAPPPVEQQQGLLRALAIALAALMVVAIAIWYGKRHRLAATSPPPATPSEADRLVHALAALDAKFERDRGNGVTRAEYERERASLKDRLTRALAGQETPV